MVSPGRENKQHKAGKRRACDDQPRDEAEEHREEEDVAGHGCRDIHTSASIITQPTTDTPKNSNE